MEGFLISAIYSRWHAEGVGFVDPSWDGNDFLKHFAAELESVWGIREPLILDSELRWDKGFCVCLIISKRKPSFFITGADERFCVIFMAEKPFVEIDAVWEMIHAEGIEIAKHLFDYEP